MPDDDNLITERLDRALEVDARRNPLPLGFATSIAESLEDRRSRRFSWFFGVPAIAAIVVLAVVAVAFPLSLTRPSTTPGQGASGSTADQPLVVATPSSITATPTAHVTPGASPHALTEAEAVEAARQAADRPGMTPVHVESGPAGEVLLPRQGFEWAHVPSDDTWVWLVNLSDGGPPLGQEGSFVVLDFFDGTIYGVLNWIS